MDRIRDSAKSAVKILAIVVLLLVLFVVGVAVSNSWTRAWLEYFVVFGFPTDKYAAQREIVIRAAEAQIPSWSFVPNGKVSVTAMPGDKGLITIPTELRVYNVFDRPTQDAILEAVEHEVRREHLLEVKVDFYNDLAGHDKWHIIRSALVK